MGRQAYLAKLAFGRSAFEPTRCVHQTDEYMQLQSARAHLPQRYQEFNGNNYVQLYDERGNPINPRSREYGKKFRNAQNDVLAAVGVVERRRSPSEGLPGSYEERLDELDLEDTIGNVLGASFTLSQTVCTWWIGTIRDRLLTFRYDDAMPLAQITALEHAISGPSILYAGFVPRMYATICTQTMLYNAFIYQPLIRLMHFTHAGQRTRKLYRLSKETLQTGLRLALEVFFYPFSYHADLQRIGLIPAHPYLPPRSSMNPFSTTSPLRPFSVYYDPSASLLDCAKAIITSPLVAVCAGHLFERWVYATINEAVDASVICPDNPDIISPEASDKYRMITTLGLRRESPPVVRSAIRKFMLFLGWGASFPESAQPLGLVEGQTVEIGSDTVTNVTPLDLTVAQAQGGHATEILDVDVLAMQDTAVDSSERPTTPVTPLASVLQFDNDDPRIRITSREGVVEMEVRLPPHVLSTHTEVADAGAPSETRRDETLARDDRPHHRVSQLSLESSEKISAIVKTQLTGLALLPFKVIILRLVASHYLACSGGDANTSRIVVPMSRLRDLSWRSVGVQVSRLALCSVLQVAIDLGIWGVQYVISLNIGKGLFGWGSL